MTNFTTGELLDRLEEVAEWIDDNGSSEKQTPWLIHRDVVREAARRLASPVSDDVSYRVGENHATVEGTQQLLAKCALQSAVSDDVERLQAEVKRLRGENQRVWAVINKMVAQADTCGCEHDDENCCAVVGEPCIVCLAASIDALSPPSAPQTNDQGGYESHGGREDHNKSDTPVAPHDGARDTCVCGHVRSFHATSGKCLCVLPTKPDPMNYFAPIDLATLVRTPTKPCQCAQFLKNDYKNQTSEIPFPKTRIESEPCSQQEREEARSRRGHRWGRPYRGGYATCKCGASENDRNLRSCPLQREHWRVEVHQNHDLVVSIEPAMLAGRGELSKEDRDTIRMAAEMLLSFVGNEDGSFFDPEEK